MAFSSQFSVKVATFSMVGQAKEHIYASQLTMLKNGAIGPDRQWSWQLVNLCIHTMHQSAFQCYLLEKASTFTKPSKLSRTQLKIGGVRSGAEGWSYTADLTVAACHLPCKTLAISLLLLLGQRMYWTMISGRIYKYISRLLHVFFHWGGCFLVCRLNTKSSNYQWDDNTKLFEL